MSNHDDGGPAKTIIACLIIVAVCSVVQIACITYGLGFKHGQKAATEAKP